jgi:nucleoside-diphosphate-sugar epimerase
VSERDPRLDQSAWIIGPADLVVVTGASGFIGARVVASLLGLGCRHLRCLVRPRSDRAALDAALRAAPAGARIEVVAGNLLSREDAAKLTAGASLVYHLAAGTRTKSFADAYLHSVVATRNLIEAVLRHGRAKRFVSMSSFAVYSNRDQPRRGLLDERCPMDPCPQSRGEAYAYAKVRQDELIMAYGADRGLPYVLVRPGAVYGPGARSFPGRVGIDTFGVFLHLGGSNTIPLTYVDNCADAVALAGLTPGIEGEAFNVVDDDLPSSRRLLALYKRHVRSFRSVYVPHAVSYGLCWLWESYVRRSEGQLPPAFNRNRWAVQWKRTRYTNDKAKRMLGWRPRVATPDGLARYFASCREDAPRA